MLKKDNLSCKTSKIGGGSTFVLSNEIGVDHGCCVLHRRSWQLCVQSSRRNSKMANLATGRSNEGEDKGMLDGVVKVPAAIQKQLDNIRDFLQTTELVTKQIPMLAILIVFARSRAKVDLEGTDPAPYAQNAFITIGILIAVQAGALFLDTCENATLKKLNLIVQGLCKLAIMVCVVIVIESIFSVKRQFKDQRF